jgi:flagellar basal body P-ring formation protein FlgA
MRAAVVALVVFGFAGAGLAETVDLPAPVGVIYPGQTIDANALSDQPFEVGGNINLGLYAREDGQLVGKMAVNTLLPGRAIALSAVRDRYLVQRGMATTLVFNTGGLDIRAIGVPLEPGSAGDVIRVRNADSGQIVAGTVDADGTIQVGAK